ncbi:MAG TPA: hypothetical protein VMV79_03420 [Alphaproteobacteria bacterium]|nr:hypothetical protein [Alphaproteobacteria bacterium]
MAKPSDLYQGNDWLTYRWPVAQAFDTLDRIRDLCLQIPVAGAPGPAMAPPRYDLPAEEIADLFHYVAELCDDLAGELDAVQADLSAYLAKSFAQRWLAFEMRLNLGELRRHTVQAMGGVAPTNALAGILVALATRIKALLRQIDQ